MRQNEPYGAIPPDLSLWEATVLLDEEVQSLRRDTWPPFEDSDPACDYDELWQDAESRCRAKCEAAIRYWLEHGRLPDLENEEAFFLLRRFDEVSYFVQQMSLEDGESIFLHPGLTVPQALRWMLVEWWNANGSRIARNDDLDAWERKHSRS